MIEGGGYDPQDQRLFTLDWGTALDQISQEVGETCTIITSTWAVSPAGPTIGAGPRAPTISADGRRTSFWVTGGTLNTSYVFTNHVTLSDSPASERDESLRLQAEAH